MHWSILNKPFPINSWRWYKTRSIFFGLFITLFLFLFKPFSLHLYDVIRLFKVSVLYGLATASVLFLGGVVFTRTIMHRIPDEEWTFGKQTLWNVFLMICITLLNCLVAQLLYGAEPFPLSLYFVMFKWVLMLGIFPVTIADLISYNYYLQKNIKSAAAISGLLKDQKAGDVPSLPAGHLPDQTRTNPVQETGTGKIISGRTAARICLTGENQGDKLEVEECDLLAVQALDNYVNIYWEKNGSLKTTLIRNTLKNIENQLETADSLLRTHRGWIVNTGKVIAVDGNAQGLKLSLPLMQVKVPVSRGNIALYRQKAQSDPTQEMPVETSEPSVPVFNS